MSSDNDDLPESTWFTVQPDPCESQPKWNADAKWEEQLLMPERLESLATAVSNMMGKRTPVEYVDHQTGSFNLVLRFRIRDDDDDDNPYSTSRTVTLRLPIPSLMVPGLLAERMENEVRWMQYFEEHHIVRVPAVYSWSVPSEKDDDHNGVGHPYILMEFVEGGEQLCECLRRWLRSDDPEDKLRCAKAYEDVAKLYLALDRHSFDKMGSITKDEASSAWAVTRRPLTMDMYVLASQFPEACAKLEWPDRDTPLDTAAEFKHLFVRMLQTQQNCLRTINIPGKWVLNEAKTAYVYALQTTSHLGSELDMDRVNKTAIGRIISRHGYVDPTFALFLTDDKDAVFKICNRDIHSRNILVDPDTGAIVCLIDLDLTTTMPAAFFDMPPLYLYSLPLGICMNKGYFPFWRWKYSSCLDQFLTIMERLEAEETASFEGQRALPPLSARMRTSWDSNQWRFCCAMSDIVLADMMFWESRSLFPEVNEADLEPEFEAFKQHTRDQIGSHMDMILASLPKRR